MKLRKAGRRIFKIRVPISIMGLTILREANIQCREAIYLLHF